MSVADMPTSPHVWVLLGQAAGDNEQILSLAKALGWSFESKQLVYNLLNHCPNLLLGASVVSLDRQRSSPLTPPWPDLVLGASRQSTPVARWIKKQSAGHTRLVHLLHVQAPLELFDLIITTPQYCLPARPNVLHNTAPLNRIAPDRLTAAASAWAPRLQHLPRPYRALFVGGNSSSYVFDPATATRLGRETSTQTHANGGSLLVSTSPRTPAAAADALFAAIDCPAYRYRWRPHDPENPYLAYLALADSFIVTADSASLLAEACTTGKPVQIFEWPVRPTQGLPIKEFLRRWSARRGNGHDEQGAVIQQTRLVQFYDRLVDWGLIKPPRDFAAYHRALQARGLVTRLGETADSTPRQPLDDMERAVTRIRQLLAGNRPLL